MINAWKKQAIEGMASVFSGKAEAAEAARLRSLSVGRRREMIEPGHPALGIVRQCELAGISR